LIISFKIENRPIASALNSVASGSLTGLMPMNLFFKACTFMKAALGCLYERGETDAYEKITFARFSLKWLEAGR